MNKSLVFILPHFFKYYKGGAETQCYYIAIELIARGWEVHYIFESDTTKISEKDDSGIILHSIPKKENYFKFLNKSVLKKILIEIDADIWYSRANISYLHVLTKLAKQNGKRSIWAFSRDSQFYYNNKEQKNASLPYKAFNLINQYFFFTSLKHTDLILLQTENQKNLLEKYRGLEGKVIYNAHPIPDNSVDKLTSHKRKKQILWIGRIRPFKRPDRLLELARKLLDYDIEILLIGKAHENTFSKEIINNAAKINNIQIIGEINSKEVHKLLLESMLLINTSDFEGFSNTFIEAWLRGVPVFTFGVNPDNIITHNNIGVVSDDINILKKAIIKLFEEPDQWQNISNKCRELGEENFNIKKSVEKLEKYFS